MTVVGRAKLDHPALGTAGGSALHTLIETIYTNVSNYMTGRYYASATIADNTTITYEHNFGAVYDDYTVLLYTGAHPNLVRVTDPVAAGWTIVPTVGFEKTKIDVTTPSSGGPHTFAVLVAHLRGAEVLDDLDDVDFSTPPEDGQALVYDAVAGDWVPGASGDASFKLQSVTDPDATIKGGFLIDVNGRELATYNGSIYGADITVDLDVILGSNPANATTYYLYIDTATLGAVQTETATGRKLYQVTESQLHLSTTTPENQTLTQYYPIGLIRSATTGTVWSGAGSEFKNLAVRRHDYPINTPKFDQTYTATPSTTVAHGLTSIPVLFQVLHNENADGKYTVVPESAVSVRADATNLYLDGFDSLLIDATHQLRIVALAVTPPVGDNVPKLVTGAGTAVNKDHILGNTSGGAFTYDLPASPQAGWTVRFSDAKRTWNTNNLTVGRNGQPIQSVASDMPLNVDGGDFTFVYIDGTEGWGVY